MSIHSHHVHDLAYDGKTNELFKIYFLNLFLSILTLGVYHFWGKTRKRRYLTSSVHIENDRFEYTGYGYELFLGLIVGTLILLILSLPLASAIYTIAQHENDPSYISENKKNEDSLHFETSDHFNKKKLIIDFTNYNKFWIVFSSYGLSIDITAEHAEIFLINHTPYKSIEIPIYFNPQQDTLLLCSLLILPLYFVFFSVFFPFIIVYVSLRYRAAHLRWRGIRGHLTGSSIAYAFIGLCQTLLKILTIGFWIPMSDAWMLQYKANRLYFGDQKGSLHPNVKHLLTMHLATLGASLYLVSGITILGYWVLPFLAHYSPFESFIIMDFIKKIFEKSYYIILAILIWGCYIPRYWYRAALLREKYNTLRFNDIQFSCHVTGREYFQLFWINDLIFIFTFGLGLPFVWQRRMQFIEQHVKVIGSLNTLSIKQNPHKKQMLGGGLGSIMNIETGVI